MVKNLKMNPFYRYNSAPFSEKKTILSDNEQELFIEHLNAQLPITITGKVVKESSAVAVSESISNSSVYTLNDFILCGDKNFEKFVDVNAKVMGYLKPDVSGKNNLLKVIDIEVNNDTPVPDGEQQEVEEPVNEPQNDSPDDKFKIIFAVIAIIAIILLLIFLFN